MEELDQGVRGMRDVTGRLHESLLVLLGRSWLDDPVREEPVAGELVEPAPRTPDPSADGGHELVHHQREPFEPHGLLHQGRRLPDVGGHHEHLERLAVDHAIQQVGLPEPLLPVGRSVRLQ